MVVQALQGLCFSGAVAGDAAEVPRPLVVELQQDDEVMWYGLISQSNMLNDVC